MPVRNTRQHQFGTCNLTIYTSIYIYPNLIHTDTYKHRIKLTNKLFKKFSLRGMAETGECPSFGEGEGENRIPSHGSFLTVSSENSALFHWVHVAVLRALEGV